MNISTIKERLHNYFEIASDKKLKAIYVLVEDEIKKYAMEYPDVFKAEFKSHIEYTLKLRKMVRAIKSKKRIRTIKKQSKRK